MDAFQPGATGHTVTEAASEIAPIAGRMLAPVWMASTPGGGLAGWPDGGGLGYAFRRRAMRRPSHPRRTTAPGSVPPVTGSGAPSVVAPFGVARKACVPEASE